MACCDSCAHGGACETGCRPATPDPVIPYDAAPVDRYNNREQLMSWNRYERAPYVYNDPLTRGGATQIRYAQTALGSSAMAGQPYTGSGGEWRRQLGELGDVPFFCPEGTSWNLSTMSCQPDDGSGGGGGGGEIEIPPGVAVVTEEQCAARELAAADRARGDARNELIVTTAVAAVISGVVGWGLGKVLK